MKFSLQQIAHLIGGDLRGDGNILVHDFAKIEEGKPGCISFLGNPKYENYIYSTSSSAVIVSKNFEPRKEITTNLIAVEDPYLAIGNLMSEYQKLTKNQKTGREDFSVIKETAKVSENCFLGSFSYVSEGSIVEENAQIFPQVFIGKNVKIGKNTIIYSGVKIYDGTEIGDHCVIHSGAVVGSDGFGFAPDANGVYQDIPQLGKVIIGNHVSIGANTTIDRATMGATLIGNGVKLDNLVQIGHNVEIGDNTVIASQSGVAGSTKIGKSCLIAGQVGFVGHITIADGTKIGAQSGVSKSITKPNMSFSGRPLLPINDYLKQQVALRKITVNDNKK
ncbi:MAG: UDP-3-O-(3-hydroxymyristoyl)glucosamine N-acyltransferase [Spirosomataceae bacterium]|jgi:UDP-3-O-[3-hydroxymyristoyl] glucosamine N-acyltransferase